MPYIGSYIAYYGLVCLDSGMGAKADTAALTELMKRGRRTKLPKGQVLQSTDNSSHLFLVTRGYVKRYLILNNGSIRTQIVYGTSDIFPLTMVFKTLLGQSLYEGPEVYYYETMTETEIYSIDSQKLEELVTTYPRLYRDLFSEAGRRLYFNIANLENVSLPTSYQRVAHQLAFLARVFGERRLFGVKITLPLTHQDIADMLSISRETVSVCMVTLRNKKLLKTSGRAIIVPDLDRLSEEAY